MSSTKIASKTLFLLFKWNLIAMNRLAVYSYLTRYTYGHAGASENLCRTIIILGQLDNWTTGQLDKSTTSFPRSDVGLDPARVR